MKKKKKRNCGKRGLDTQLLPDPCCGFAKGEKGRLDKEKKGCRGVRMHDGQEREPKRQDGTDSGLPGSPEQGF